MSKREKKVATEVAELEFVRFADTFDLDIDEEKMSEEDRESFTVAKETIVEAIEYGLLTIDGEGRPVYTPRKGDTTALTFREPTGAMLLTMETKKQGENIRKMAALMAGMTGTSEGRFSNMVNSDLKVCTTLAAFFLVR